jgi:hypothetical protein
MLNFNNLNQTLHQLHAAYVLVSDGLHSLESKLNMFMISIENNASLNDDHVSHHNETTS